MNFTIIITRAAHCFAGNNQRRGRRFATPKPPILSLGFAAMILSWGLHVNTFAASYDAWFFTAAEVEAAHQYQEYYGERIRNPLPARDCMFGQSEIIAAYRG